MSREPSSSRSKRFDCNPLNYLYSQMAIYTHTELDRTFHALGDSSRRQMLAKLALHGECTASELGAQFNCAQPTISKHIKVLENAGLVDRTVEGRVHRFRLRTESLNDAEDWIKRHKSFWEGTLQRLESFVLNSPAKDANE